ncbi:MAG: PTS sugar transporter subunit IIA [Eubacteriales bacterium]
MFFKKKKLPLLAKENIVVGCKADTKETVIRTIGQMLVDGGYVGSDYIEGMIAREESFSTYMGNGLALPHGVEAVKKTIKSSGIAVMTFPEGTSWGEETAKVVIAIAGAGGEHLEILGNIAEKMMDEETIEKIVHGDVETVYSLLV